MKRLHPSDVPNPNLFKPERMKEVKEDQYIGGSLPDFFVPFENPFKEEEGEEDICHLPCRRLDPGEIYVLQRSADDKYPPDLPKDLQEKKWEDMTADEKTRIEANVVAKAAVDNELYTDALQGCVIQKGWDRESLAKLPRGSRREGYEGAMMGAEKLPPIIDAFSEAGGRGGSEDSSDMPRGVSDEPTSEDSTRGESVSE